MRCCPAMLAPSLERGNRLAYPGTGVRYAPGAASPDSEQAALVVVEALGTVDRDGDQLAGLHSGALVAGDDVRLDDEGHSLLEHEVRDPLERARPVAEHGREIA